MRLRSPLALLLALLLAAFAAACGSDDDTSGGETVGETTTTAPDDDGSGDDDRDEEGLATASVTVELLDAGQEPRQVLRLRPGTDCEQQVTQRQAITQRPVSGELDGRPIPPEQLVAAGQATGGQSTETDLTFTCNEIEDDRIEVTNRYDELRIVDAPAEQAEQLEQLYEGFRGAEGRLVYDAEGRLLDVEAPDVEIDDDLLGPVFAAGMEQMLDSLDDALAQSANPFPEEEIGVGGRWRVTATFDIAGLAARSVTEYTLTGVDGDEVLADTTSTLEFIPGAIEFPGMPTGGSAEILAGSMAGTGTARWDLTGVITYFEQAQDGTLTMRIGADDQAIEMTMEQHQELSLQPR